MAIEMSTAVGLIPALAFGSIFLLVYGLQQAFDRRSARLAGLLGRYAAGQRTIAPRSAADLARRRRRFSTIGTLDTLLLRQGFAERMDKQLASAGLPLRVGEYLLIRWGIALALAGSVGVTLGSPLLGLPVGAVGFLLPAFYVRQRQHRRLEMLNQQLVDALALIAGGLRAGYSFLQGVEAAARELPSPLSDELKVMLEELRIGVPVEEALLGLAARAPTEDVDMAVTAMLIQRQSGGNLAEILDNIGHTIRERLRIRREVLTLTAQERMSARLISSLPVLFFAFLRMVNPDYLDVLFSQTIGHLLLAAAVTLVLIGYYAMRRIMDIRL